MTKTKKEIIPRKFFKSPRLEIMRILVEEIQRWESATKVTEEELLRLVERITREVKITSAQPKRKKK